MVEHAQECSARPYSLIEGGCSMARFPLLSRFARSSPYMEPLRFGVATADHQGEAYDPQHEDIRDVWEQRRGLTKRGRATDFWNRYPEDVQLACGLGCTVFRFSLAWSRLEPL